MYTLHSEFIQMAKIKLYLMVILFLFSSMALSLNKQEKSFFCPLVKDLRKQGVYWVSGDNWRSYSESFTNRIGSFIGAQWIGVQVGKIICLYVSDDKNFDFPISLEQIQSSIVIQPNGNSWSALIDNHKICHSTNVVDCPFYVKQEEKIDDIYKAIEYNPSKIGESDY